MATEGVDKTEKKAKKAATRQFYIGSELGYEPYSLNLKERTGDHKAIEEQAMQVKDQIVAICSKAGGQLVGYDRVDGAIEDEDEDEDGEEIEGFDYCVVDIEFPDDDSTRRAVEEVRESCGMYGVQIFDPDAKEDCQLEFITPDTLDTSIRDGVENRIRSVCRDHGGELIRSEACNRRRDRWDIMDTYQFQAASQVEAAVCEVRETCGQNLVHIYWKNWRQLPREIAESVMATGLVDDHHWLLVGPCSSKEAADESDCSLVREINFRTDCTFDCTYDEWVGCLRDEVRQAAEKRAEPAAPLTEVLDESVDLSTWLHEAQTTGLEDGTMIESRGDGWVVIAGCGRFLLDPRDASRTSGKGEDLPPTIFPTVEAVYAAWQVQRAALEARQKRCKEALRRLGRN